MDSDWDSGRFAGGTLDCILCKQTLLYSSGNKSEFVHHLMDGHRVKYHHNLLLAITFLDNDSLDNIINQFEKHSKSIENKTVNDNVAANIARKKMNQAKRLLEGNALMDETFMAKRMKRNGDENNGSMVDESVLDNFGNFNKKRAKQLALKCNVELKSGGLFPTVKNLDQKNSDWRQKNRESSDFEKENHYLAPPKVIKVIQQTGKFDKGPRTKNTPQLSPLLALDDIYSNPQSLPSVISKSTGFNPPLTKPDPEGKSKMDYYRENFRSKLEMASFNDNNERLKKQLAAKNTKLQPNDSNSGRFAAKDTKFPPNDSNFASNREVILQSRQRRGGVDNITEAPQKTTGVVQKSHNRLLEPFYEENQSDQFSSSASLTIDDIFSNPQPASSTSSSAFRALHTSRLKSNPVNLKFDSSDRGIDTSGVKPKNDTSKLNLGLSPQEIDQSVLKLSSSVPVVDISGWKLYPLEYPLQFGESQLKLDPEHDSIGLKRDPSTPQVETSGPKLSSYSPEVGSSTLDVSSSSEVDSSSSSPEDDLTPETDLNESGVLDPLAITGENDFVPVFAPNQHPVVKSKSVIKSNASCSNQALNFKTIESSPLKDAPESDEASKCAANQTKPAATSNQTEASAAPSNQTEAAAAPSNQTEDWPLDESKLKLSNDMGLACRTYCRLCGDGTTKTLTQMRSHTKSRHNVNISDYKAKFGNEYEIIEEVYHKCGICEKIVLLDSDSIAVHLKSREHKARDTNGTTHKNYNETFMAVKKTNSALSVLGF